MSETAKCPGCGATIRKPRKVSMAVAIEHHNESCPKR